MPKINVVIGNPPYTNGIHLDHLQKSYENTDRVVLFIHPMAWVNAQKPGRNSLKHRADKLKQLVGDHFVSFRIVNPNKEFGIKLGQVGGITLIDKTKTHASVEVEDRTVGKKMVFPDSTLINSMYLDPSVFQSLKEKIWNYCLSNNMEDRVNKNISNSFFVNLPLISGHVDESGLTDSFFKSDFFQLVYETDKAVTTSPKKNKQNRWLSFPTKAEAQNCLEYLSNSKLAKFCLMIVKSQQNLHRGELLFVPAFDFSKPCPDKDLYKILKITKEEAEIIERIAA